MLQKRSVVGQVASEKCRAKLGKEHKRELVDEVFCIVGWRDTLRNR